MLELERPDSISLGTCTCLDCLNMKKCMTDARMRAKNWQMYVMKAMMPAMSIADSFQQDIESRPSEESKKLFATADCDAPCSIL